MLRECHRRLATGKPVTSITLGSLDRGAQDAVADLLGLTTRPRPGTRLRLADIATAVEQLSGQSFRDALTTLFGPIGNRAAERAQTDDARAGLWSWLRDHPVVHDKGLSPWVASVESGGVRDTVESMRTNLERALLVLATLPSPGEPLPVLAGRILNDTHALDHGSPVATLVLGALAVRHGVDRPRLNRERRALWHAVGVSDDALSSTVLVAGLDALGSTAADRMCQLGHTDGRAVTLTLADLQDGVPTLAARSGIYVVENPAVLWLAVTELGRATPPMICISGWPSTAAMTLLSGLAQTGAQLRYHGDLDGEGVRIAAHVFTETGAVPWRMTAADYCAHVASHGAPVGRVTPAPWDEHLGPAMKEAGIAVLEETVWADLRHDLVEAGEQESIARRVNSRSTSPGQQMPLEPDGLDRANR
jgi:uncharacterized protein (TIGR02679 family)